MVRLMRRWPNRERSIALTIMGDIDGGTRNENGRSAGILEVGGVC